MEIWAFRFEFFGSKPYRFPTFVDLLYHRSVKKFRKIPPSFLLPPSRTRTRNSNTSIRSRRGRPIKRVSRGPHTPRPGHLESVTSISIREEEEEEEREGGGGGDERAAVPW